MPDLFTVSDTVLASMIVAGTTLFTALLNLRSSWKRELKERERGQPITKKNRRGPILAILLLMVGCGVGGFAFSQYLMVRDEQDSRGANAEMRAELAKILAATERLERASSASSAANAVACKPPAASEGPARESAPTPASPGEPRRAAALSPQ